MRQEEVDGGGSAPPDFSEDGIDLTVIRWMLSRTPRKRPEFLEQRIEEILSIRALNAGTSRGG